MYERWPTYDSSSLLVHSLLSTQDFADQILTREAYYTVAVVNSGYYLEALVLRCLFFIHTKYQFALHAIYILGTLNSWADEILRNYMDYLYLQISGLQYQ